MKVLLVGGGGREHAIALELAKSPRVDELLCAPGNAGIARVARCFPSVKADDVAAQVALAMGEHVDFVVVAPDDPLAKGLVDALSARGIRAYGPTQNAARLESSKIYSKELMRKYGVPTAGFRCFDDAQQALDYADAHGAPIVVKADGLALGKGVVVAGELSEARQAIIEMMREKKFKASGERILLEDCIYGPELTLLCFVCGDTIRAMPISQDHKRALDGDMGKNTGGMGAIAPSPLYTPEMQSRVEREVLRPTMDMLHGEGIDFRGVLYIGLMLTERGPQVIEYNARFGDPETQVVLPLLETDLMRIFEATADGTLAELPIVWREEACACVVLASGGYPDAYQTGKPIAGVERAEAMGARVYHAGTALSGGQLVTAGGRVLGVTCTAGDLKTALERAYRAAAQISFEGMHMRRDIGAQAL